jgi:G3E family GTPase
MKVVTISGTQGSGKTTLIRELIGRVGAFGNRSAIIVNEDGEETFDEKFIQAHKIIVERLRGG